MAREVSRRNMLAAGLSAMGGLAVAGAQGADGKAETKAPVSRSALNLDGLGKVLKAVGIQGKLREKAYDYTYSEKDSVGEEWNLSMSAVLSNDEQTIWLMAWLDELPQSAGDVPRTALLRLLSDNDMIGNGIFFAYVKSNRRFILQRVLKNENVTTSSMKADLEELAFAVMNTYSHWSVRNWKQLTGTTETASASKETESDESVKPSAGGVSRTATKEPTTSTKSRK